MLQITIGEIKMKNEEMLNEIREIFKSFDKDLDALSIEVAFIKGVVAESQRHNGKVIKVLCAVVTALLGIIAWLVRG